jgi:hypothetical protein
MQGLRLTRGTQDISERCGYYVLDDSEIFVFSHNGEEKQIRNKCTNAEESYARQVLGWPKGRLVKPSIFRESTTRTGDHQACVTQFFHHIGQLLERKAHEDSKQLEVYPFAFVVFEGQSCLRRPVHMSDPADLADSSGRLTIALNTALNTERHVKDSSCTSLQSLLLLLYAPALIINFLLLCGC